MLDLGGGVSEHLRVWIRGRPGLEAAVGEQVGRAPEQLDARALLIAKRIVGEGIKIGAKLGEAGAFRRDVDVVEAVVGRAHLGEELERDGHLLSRACHLVGGDQPRPIQRSAAEHVPSVPGERVPEAHARPEMVFHPLTENHSVRLVHLERKRVSRACAPKRDPTRDLAEELFAHSLISFCQQRAHR